MSGEECAWREGTAKRRSAESANAAERNPIEKEARWLSAVDRWLSRVVRDLGGGLSIGAMDESAQVLCAGVLPKPNESPNESPNVWSCEAHSDFSWQGSPAILEFDANGLVALTWKNLSAKAVDERRQALRKRWADRCESGSFDAVVGGRGPEIAPFQKAYPENVSVGAGSNFPGLTPDDTLAPKTGDTKATFGGEILQCATPGGPVLALARFSEGAARVSHFSVVVFAIGE